VPYSGTAVGWWFDLGYLAQCIAMNSSTSHGTDGGEDERRCLRAKRTEP